MQRDPITFEQFLLSKGVVNPGKLHPNELSMWHAAYVQEVPYDLQTTFIIGESKLQDVDMRIKAGASPIREGWRVVHPVQFDIKAAEILDESIELKGCASPAEFQIEAAESDGKKKLPTFSMIAYTGGPMHPGGWYRSEPIVVDLEGMEIPSQTLPIDKGHGVEVGHSTAVDMTPGKTKLKVKGVLSGFSEDAQHNPARAAREIVDLAKNGFPYQASIDAHISKLERFDDGEKVTVNGQALKGPLYVARASTLRGVAILTGAADMNTQTTIAAQLGENMQPEFLAWLKANEYTDAEAAALTGKKLATLQAAWQATKAPLPPQPEPAKKAETPALAADQSFDQKMAVIEAENQRVTYIRERTAAEAEKCIGDSDMLKNLRELCASAIEDKKIDARAFDLSLVRVSRCMPPQFFSTKQPQVNDAVLEASLCRYAGVRDVDKAFKPEILEAADKNFRHGLSLLGLVETIARRNGWRGSSVKADLRRAVRAAFREDDYRDIQASVGPSTYSISNILSATTNRMIRVAYDAVEAEWRKIAMITSVTDYREIASVALTGDMVYKKVPRGGEVKHGTFGDTPLGNKADIYALLIGIDEQDLVNDDIGALAGMARRVGRGGAITMNQVFWAEWLDDSAFFTAGLDNYDDGATDSVLTDAGLANMTGIFRAQVDPDGQPLGIRPKILLVPPALETRALTLMNSESLNLVTASTALTGNANVWNGRFQVVSSDYLTDPLAWYLLANPQDLAAIEMVFLNGVEVPQTETADMAIDRLGIVIRGKHSFGARKQDYRAAVKAKGAT